MTAVRTPEYEPAPPRVTVGKSQKKWKPQNLADEQSIAIMQQPPAAQTLESRKSAFENAQGPITGRGDSTMRVNENRYDALRRNGVRFDNTSIISSQYLTNGNDEIELDVVHDMQPI